MSGNVTEWEWSKKRLEAAALVADDTHSDEEIAAKIGITDRTLYRWKAEPAFAAKVREIVRELEAALEAEAIRQGIALRRTRIEAANDRHARMLRVIEERAVEMGKLDEATGKPLVAGGGTGLIVRTPMMFGDKYQVDRGLLAELRELEKQIAQEAGHWSEKHELTGRDGGPIQTESVVVYMPDNGRDNGDSPAKD